MNQTILHGLKTHLMHAKSLWMMDLYNILWTYRITSKPPMEEMTLRLAFGTKAVIPLDIELPTLQTERFKLENNQAQLQANLDFLDSMREQALVRIATYRQRAVRYYNSIVKTKVFKVDDLVL